MKIKHPFILFFSLIIGFFSCTLTLFGQGFNRIENISGLNNIDNSNGIAVADYDGDYDLDIFIVALAQDEEGKDKTHSKLFRNDNNGSFTEVTNEAGLINLLPLNEEYEPYFGLKGFKHGVSWGDFDNDGFPDLFFTHSYKVQLFHNQGDGTFVEITGAAGFISENGCRNTGSTWFDYNNDGYLDIYISNWGECSSNLLYKNNGNGTFVDVTEETGILATEELASYIAIPFDINNDGWMDLYVSNDKDKPNSLFINQNGISFNDQAEEYGLNSAMDDMGIAVGDFNLNGNFDFFITGRDEVALFKNNGSNSFNNATIANNLTSTNSGWAWGTTFADFDLDGDEDLILVNGFEFNQRNKERNIYYKNLQVEEGGGFSDKSVVTNFNDLAVSVEVVDFDFDNDGDLDVFVSNSDQNSFFYENKIIDNNNSLHWFKVNLQGTSSNRDAIGTTLTLTTEQGEIKRYYSGVGFLSQSLQAVHFGLNDLSIISKLEIKWPSGLVETLDNLNVNTTIKAIEGEGFTELDIEPSIKLYGCTDPNSCNYNPNATSDDGSCTYLNSSQILGAINSGFYKNETYTYPIESGSTANWNINNGEILNGQGTSEITVKWGLNENGIISVIETNNNCSNLEVKLNVNLNISEIPDDKSIARIWNEALLIAIRGDYARPTVHARNLFHSSIAMYDAWAIYDDTANPYLIGKELNGFKSELLEFVPSEAIDESRKKAICYAMYNLLSYRFKNSPNVEESQLLFDLIMEQLGYDITNKSSQYELGDAESLGNYIAETIIEYGKNDGSRELTLYDNAYYKPINLALAPVIPSVELMLDPNRWQPLSLDTFIDQSGNYIEGTTPEFLSPEWGNVLPFAMDEESLVTYSRNGNNYKVYNDPGNPPYLNLTSETEDSDAYKWGFSMVSIWGSHLDPDDGVLWDISPGAIGNTNIETFPLSYSDFPNYYNLVEGGDIGKGHSLNPITGKSYEPQIVPRGDYTRVLAEFWADGPHSETPPGHWFTILNYVNDHPLFEKKFEGEGIVLNPLEWDVKSYFILGGTMHDAAISAWSIKGWYDYVRPISAIRNMVLLGQSTDNSLDNYNVAGIPLKEGFIEIVKIDDPLIGKNNKHLGKVKVYTWRGHDFIDDTETDKAGVGWILAENWWPYQRPTFVTPPFAGFVSGHSTYSRAAAEVLTQLTGDMYFPGGIGEFTAKQNEFLVFEEGPSTDITLQWATYRDASDQTSLSRIWGGIHPPADDIPGRFIGEKIGIESFNYAVSYFSGKNQVEEAKDFIIYPNPIMNRELNILNTKNTDVFDLFDLTGRIIKIIDIQFFKDTNTTKLKLPNSLSSGLYFISVNSKSKLISVL